MIRVARTNPTPNIAMMAYDYNMSDQQTFGLMWPLAVIHLLA
jgi:hypothetical protein